MTTEARRPVIIGVGGFSSGVGKTTLLCELLRRGLAGWEAIKVTRGHYRSCGKDPHACCVSPLLGDAPLVRSGRRETYVPGKDTGLYWEAGAAEVHWVIATDEQIEEGVRRALGRVRAPGVLIEGNSFLRFIEADLFLMVARAEGGKIKPTARRALARTSALYLSDRAEGAEARARFENWRASSASSSAPEGELLGRLPVYTAADLTPLVQRIKESW